MNLTITGRHIEVTDAIRNSAEERFKRLNDRFDVISQKLTFEKVRHEFHVHAEYETDHGVMVANTEHADLYKGIHDVTDKLERQLKKAKPSASRSHEKATDQLVEEEAAVVDEAELDA